MNEIKGILNFNDKNFRKRSLSNDEKGSLFYLANSSKITFINGDSTHFSVNSPPIEKRSKNSMESVRISEPSLRNNEITNRMSLLSHNSFQNRSSGASFSRMWRRLRNRSGKFLNQTKKNFF